MRGSVNWMSLPSMFLALGTALTWWEWKLKRVVSRLLNSLTLFSIYIPLSRLLHIGRVFSNQLLENIMLWSNVCLVWECWWSAHFDAAYAPHEGFANIKHACTGFCTRKWTQGERQKDWGKNGEPGNNIFDNSLGRCSWVNQSTKPRSCSEYVGTYCSHEFFESLKAYLEEIRDKFSEHELKARARCPDSDYSVVNRPKNVGLQMRYDRPEVISSLFWTFFPLSWKSVQIRSLFVDWKSGFHWKRHPEDHWL